MIARLLAAVLRHHRAILVAYAVAVPVAIWQAMHIPAEGSIDRLIVPGDPDYAATRAFQRIFPESRLALLVFEAPDPWAPDAIARVDRAEHAIARVPHVTAFSVLDAIRHARPDATVAELRALATGTAFFAHQGLVGDRFMTVIANLDVHGSGERDAALAGIDHALGDASVRRTGEPYVAAWLEHQSASSTSRSFAVFGVLLVAITVFLYRSARALAAIVIALGSAVALGVAAGGALGMSFTIVSALVPLTIMVTTLAALTYLHSRFVDQPAGVDLATHHVEALRNKFLPVTASAVAAAAGFAALAVSTIRPIRELGIWTAVGLAIAWLVVYTLFPALQRALRTPTARRVAVRSATYDRIAARLPRFTYRHRRVLVAIGLAGCAAGVVAITGIPGAVRPMPLEIDTLANIDPGTALYRDLRWFRDHVTDLNVARVWIHVPDGTATDPGVLRALDGFHSALEATRDVTGVTGPTTPLRMRSYFAGRGDHLPADPAAFAAATADVEQLMLTEPAFRAFVDVDRLADVQLTVLFRNGDAAGYAALERRIAAAWRDHAVPGATLRVVGESLLQVKIGASLVPTLAESFAITCVVILVVFVVIFRSGIERVLAMLPSVFALAMTFLGLRLAGGALDVATILIATTVLGTTENDQLHFFHHMHELPAGAGTGARLRHALAVSGRAIVFATLINAVGFLGLASSSFPPLRQFGILTASAFVLALIADLLILPAALWIVRPDHP
jgi:hypothetical protein